MRAGDWKETVPVESLAGGVVGGGFWQSYEAKQDEEDCFVI